MVISQDLIDRIRAVADAERVRQASQLEGAPQPVSAAGPETYDVKVTP
jgi:hypothetical protein